jgi:hypothetical protein
LIEGKEGLGRRRPKTFWLIVQDDTDQPMIFELETGSRVKSLPIFSFEEEAQLFLRLGGLERRWRASETDATTLAETCSGTEYVVLDPFPEIGLAAPDEAVSLRWEMFLDLLSLPRQPAALPPYTGR